MMMTKVFSVCNIAGLIALLPLALSATDGKKDSAATATPEKRLVLLPQAHLQLTAEPIWGDSVEAVVTVAVPDSCKNQRYLCRLEAGAAMRFVTVPRYQWALREDSLKVLSAVPLQIRIARPSFTASTAVVNIHFQNVDHTAGLTGTATLEILSDVKSLATLPALSLAAMPAADSAQMPQPLPVIPSTAVDTVATATGSNSSGIFYIALAILLIFLFAGLGWLMTWPQRRRFQSSAAKTTVAAFPHLQQLEPAPAAAAQNDNPIVNEAATGENGARKTPEVISPPTNLPAVVAQENQLDLALVLSQLHELKITLQQIMANQHEVNQRLAQITAVTAPGASAQLALFDILNDETSTHNGESYVNGNGSSPLPLQPADHDTDRRPAEDKSVSKNFGSTSNLRIFFANTEGRNETADEVLLH